MKGISLLFLGLMFTTPLQARIRPSDSGTDIPFYKDPRKWVTQYQNQSKRSFIAEFVVEGESINSWKEMAAQQFEITKAFLPAYVATWRQLLLKADSKIEIKEETDPDGSIFVTMVVIPSTISKF